MRKLRLHAEDGEQMVGNGKIQKLLRACFFRPVHIVLESQRGKQLNTPHYVLKYPHERNILIEMTSENPGNKKVVEVAYLT